MKKLGNTDYSNSAVAQKCYCGELSCKGYIGGSLKEKAPNDDTEIKVDIDEEDDDDNDESSQDDENENETDDQIEEIEIAEAVTLTQKKMLRKCTDKELLSHCKILVKFSRL